MSSSDMSSSHEIACDVIPPPYVCEPNPTSTLKGKDCTDNICLKTNQIANQMYLTLDEAREACKETEGCAHVMYFNNDSSHNGYFLRRETDPDVNVDEALATSSPYKMLYNCYEKPKEGLHEYDN